MNKRVEGLEGMRGIAAFLVYTHHFFLIFYPAFYFGPHTWINHLLNPDLAVAWFFVHSGFVLAYHQRNLKDQALRRYLRLLPPVLFSILATYVVMKLHLNANHEFAKVTGSTWLGQYLNFGPSLLEALKQSFFGVYFDFKSGTTYNPNLWTIGYELISSYLLFGVLALVGWWKKSAWPLIALALVISPWKGLMCFLLGAFLSRLPVHRAHPFILGAFTVLGFFLADLKGPFEAYARNIGAALLMYVLLKAPRFREVLEKKFFKRLGEISYSLYALHFLILVTVTSSLGLRDVHVALNYLITTATLVSFSYLAWRFIDAPGIRFAKKFSGLFFVNKPAGRTVT